MSEKDIARVKASGIVKQLNRVLINALGADNRHLYESDSDVDARHEAFWFVGGMDPPTQLQKMRAHGWFKDYANDPIDRPFQYIGKPFLALRHQLPLEPFEEMDFSSLTCANQKISIVKLDPRVLGLTWFEAGNSRRHATCVPGFWPGNVREYGLVSFQDRYYINQRRKEFGEEDKQNALHSQGIVSSYAWTLAQACYQGFSTYNDMNYPLATQTVITDGQLFSFYKYQLNTTCIHTSVMEPNYRYNKCWGTDEMKLYDQIDENGKLQGLNDDVLKNLIQFYINQPKERQHEMKPFLDKDAKKIADLENVEQRKWLEQNFKRIISNRPRHLRVPEIYDWEWIYKIKNKTRPMDKKTRFFEIGVDPFKRRLDEHKPKYIPKLQRARGIRDKKKWEATYYPLNHRMNIPKEVSHSMIGAPADPWACSIDRKRKSYK